TSAWVLPSTFLMIRLPVLASYPAVYRPSQRPSFRFLMLPSPLARFFVTRLHLLFCCLASPLFLFVVERVQTVCLQFFRNAPGQLKACHKTGQRGFLPQQVLCIHKLHQFAPLKFVQTVPHFLTDLFHFFLQLCEVRLLEEPLV